MTAKLNNYRRLFYFHSHSAFFVVLFDVVVVDFVLVRHFLNLDDNTYTLRTTNKLKQLVSSPRHPDPQGILIDAFSRFGRRLNFINALCYLVFGHIFAHVVSHFFLRATHVGHNH